MDIVGKIERIFPAQSGVGKTGNNWKKQEFLIVIPGQFEKRAVFNTWGDRIDLQQFAEGEEVRVHFDIESREFNGKYYTDLRAWRIDKMGASNASPQGASQDYYNQSVPASNYNNIPASSESAIVPDDDLPF